MAEIVLPNLIEEYLHDHTIQQAARDSTTLFFYTTPPASSPPGPEFFVKPSTAKLPHLTMDMTRLQFRKLKITGMFSKLLPPYYALNIPHNFIVRGMKPCKIVSPILSLISLPSQR